MTEAWDYWLALHHAQMISRSTVKAVLDQYHSIESLFALDTDALEDLDLTKTAVACLKSPDRDRIDKELCWLERRQHHLITYHDSDYPALLREIPDPPPLLFAKGQRQAIENIQFSIVGSRNPTHSGRRLATDFALQLAQLGVTVSSGLALGIDYASHLGALQAGGSTIAVLGNGLDSIYPAVHQEIASRIIEQGLLLSEFSPDAKPLPHHFPIRNRIISGMSIGVLVVEAAVKSGSLITARHALHQGREVFAIPGSIHNPLAKGCHALIKQGAKLVEHIRDIVEELPPMLRTETMPQSANKPFAEQIQLDGDYQLLLNNMGFDPITVDQLVDVTGLTAEAISSMLLILELDGVIESQHSGYYVRIK